MKYSLMRTDAAKCEHEIDCGDFAQIAEGYIERCEAEPTNAHWYSVLDEEGEDVYIDELNSRRIGELLPRRLKDWAICSRCRGEGTCLIDGLEGVAFTMSEFLDTFDYEERDAYFNGGYDRSCPDCNATGKLLLVNDEKLELSEPLVAKWRWSVIEDEFEWECERAAERRMGA